MKKLFKKALSILIAFVMVFGTNIITSFIGLDFSVMFGFKAEAATYSGTCAENLTWNLDTITGELTISGTGAMRDWSGYYSHAPWYDYSSYIEKVTIDNNVTCIGADAFEDCTNVTCVTIPDSITSVGDSAFKSCNNLKDVYFDGTNTEWNSISIGANNKLLLNATIHTKSIIVTVDAYTTVDGSVAQFKEYGVTISSDDENAPMPDETYLITNNLGCVSFPIEISEEDLQGLDSKSFKYALTINSANGKKYDFSPETQQVEITINNSNGKLSCIGLEDYYNFNGYSYRDFAFSLTWDDGHDCCNVRPDSLNLYLVSNRNDERIPFTINMDNRWRATLSVREVDDEFNYHKYSVEGLDYLENIGYNIYQYESDSGYFIDAVAELPYCTVSFYTQNGTAPANQYVVKNSLAAEPEEPVRQYYNFAGWYKDENCSVGNEWNFAIDVITQNTTIYAKWEPKLISITLKTEYGVLQDGEKSKELTITIPACSAVGIKLSEEIYDSNYNHIGWVDEDGNAVTATTKLYEDTPLYAVWQKKPYYDSTASIKNNTGSKTINYGETLKLSVNTTNMPDGSKICWYVDGVKKGEGEVFEVSFEGGTKIVTVKIIGSDGNALKDVNGNEISDSETVTVKSGFFQKLISFFKNLFGANRTVVQSIFKVVI